MHLNTLTGPDLYTGLDQWQIPSDGSNLRRGIELKHIPRIFTLFLKRPARHELNQVGTGCEFQLKAPTVIINISKIPMTPKYQYTCIVSYWKQQSSTRDTGVRDTDLQLPSACDPAFLCTKILGQRATKVLVTATFTTKRLVVIMFPKYTVQTMGSNTSSWLLLTL